ncbi:11014_t:CDS:2 [Ambispora leptoticha]|uniref:11014_t:CDS:1 n=1 Tax=Ambispora leptoticha TaxID=144679 RepID=A0A9N8WGJ8_9GLOM|nr:11014_t:CDS:2 [Ambispora leptoticha]
MSNIPKQAGFKIFEPLIKDVRKYADKIGECYEHAEHNRRICSVLLKRANSAAVEVKSLRQLKNEYTWFFENSVNYPIFRGFVKVIENIQNFVIDISQLQGLIKYYNEYRGPGFSIDRKFYSLISEFEKATEELTIALQNRLVFVKPKGQKFEDKEAIERDMRDMEKYIETIEGATSFYSTDRPTLTYIFTELFDLSRKNIQQPASRMMPNPRPLFAVQTIQDAINMHKKDGREAVIYFERSADNGNSTAMYNVGKMYYNGNGVIQNMEKGVYYLRLAALKGQPEAIDMCKKYQIPL